MQISGNLVFSKRQAQVLHIQHVCTGVDENKGEETKQAARMVWQYGKIAKRHVCRWALISAKNGRKSNQTKSAHTVQTHTDQVEEAYKKFHTSHQKHETMKSSTSVRSNKCSPSARTLGCMFFICRQWKGMGNFLSLLRRYVKCICFKRSHTAKVAKQQQRTSTPTKKSETRDNAFQCGVSCVSGCRRARYDFDLWECEKCDGIQTHFNMDNFEFDNASSDLSLIWFFFLSTFFSGAFGSLLLYSSSPYYMSALSSSFFARFSVSHFVAVFSFHSPLIMWATHHMIP